MLLKFKQPVVIVTITLFSLLSIQAQKAFDLSSVNYTNMNNNQLQLLFQEASSNGYSYDDILKAAEAQGLSEEEIAEGFALLCVGRALTPDLKLSLE